MNKFLSLVLGALTAFSASAGITAENWMPQQSKSNLTPQISTLRFEKAQSTTIKTMSEADGTADIPESITGKTYIVTSNDFDATRKPTYNVATTVKSNSDGTITFTGLVAGFDVKGSYDSTTGKVTIPTGYVIGQNSNYGDVTMYALDMAEEVVTDDNVTGTVTGNEIVFDLGFYATVVVDGTNYYIDAMDDVKATESNATLTFTTNGYDFSIPLFVTKTSDSSLSIVGISNVLYGSYYEVPLLFDKEVKTGYINSTSPVDSYDYYNRVYYLGSGITDDALSNLGFTITQGEAAESTVLSAPIAYCVYYAGMVEGYKGYMFESFTINVDFDIFAETGTGEEELPATATVGNINYSLDAETLTAEVIGCAGSLSALNIPETITVSGKTLTVTSVAEKAFYSNRTIKSASIPATIQTVGTDAFRNMSNLNTLEIADMKAWCEIEFGNGNANPIYNVFPTSTSKWGKVFFNGEQVSTNLVIPEGVTVIGRSFYGFKSLETVTLPSSLTRLGDQAFANCAKITEIEIPASVEYIGSAFFSCSGLETVTLNEGLKTLGASTFYGTSKLTSLTLPATLENFDGYSTFSGSGLTELTVKASVPPTFKYEMATMYFNNVEAITLYVPLTAADAYAAAAVWSEFTDVKTFDDVVGINEIEAETDADAVYFNLQGVRVDNPANGIFIKVTGKKSQKVLIK